MLFWGLFITSNPNIYLEILTGILKVLSSEMDPVEIRLIRQIFIKGSVAVGF
jgi:hypothetical protein